MNYPTYEIRPCGWHPRTGDACSQTFSVAIGWASRPRAAAVFRVRGQSTDHEAIDRLAGRLVDWLNNDTGLCPFEVPDSNDKSARIVLTKAGRKAGFMPIGRII